MAAKLIASAIRHGLTAFSGYLVAQGLVNEVDAAAFVGPASMFLGTLLWSAWQKYGDRLT